MTAPQARGMKRAQPQPPHPPVAGVAWSFERSGKSVGSTRACSRSCSCAWVWSLPGVLSARTYPPLLRFFGQTGRARGEPCGWRWSVHHAWAVTGLTPVCSVLCRGASWPWRTAAASPVWREGADSSAGPIRGWAHTGGRGRWRACTKGVVGGRERARAPRGAGRRDCGGRARDARPRLERDRQRERKNALCPTFTSRETVRTVKCV